MDKVFRIYYAEPDVTLNLTKSLPIKMHRSPEKGRKTDIMWPDSYFVFDYCFNDSLYSFRLRSLKSIWWFAWATMSANMEVT